MAITSPNPDYDLHPPSTPNPLYQQFFPLLRHNLQLLPQHFHQLPLLKQFYISQYQPQNTLDWRLFRLYLLNSLYPLKYV